MLYHCGMEANAAAITIRFRSATRLFAALLLCVAVLLLFAAWLPTLATAMIFSIAAMILLKVANEKADLTNLASRLEALAGTRVDGEADGRIEHAAAALEKIAALRGDRDTERHSITGLPTREPLLLLMKQDRQGTLGVLSFPDFDRLCAFDPPLAERLLIDIAARLRKMLSPEHMLAQIDRAALALWFGPSHSEQSAQTVLVAIEYALGSEVKMGERAILPEVRSRLVLVTDEEPELIIARTLSRLAVDKVTAAAGKLDASATGQDLNERFIIEQDLRQAISRGQLRMVYQPIIDATRNKICGAEALMRWHHPERGLVSPSEFFPIVETSGLSHEFGLWALNTACRDAQQCVADGLGNIRIAVNVSALQLERRDLPALIERTLARHSLPADAIEIELTETAAMVDCDRIAGLFASLRATGVRIAIDDFGTGYSSLSTLRKLSFDKIKIDREFITEVESRPDSQAICQSLITLARGLKIAVLAEGVERKEEYAWLLRHGCTFFQGYYFSRPVDFTDFVSLCRDQSIITDKILLGPKYMQLKITERLSA